MKDAGALVLVYDTLGHHNKDRHHKGRCPHDAPDETRSIVETHPLPRAEECVGLYRLVGPAGAVGANGAVNTCGRGGAIVLLGAGCQPFVWVSHAVRKHTHRRRRVIAPVVAQKGVKGGAWPMVKKLRYTTAPFALAYPVLPGHKAVYLLAFIS